MAQVNGPTFRIVRLSGLSSITASGRSSTPGSQTITNWPGSAGRGPSSTRVTPAVPSAMRLRMR